jgi:hypothetical protein
MYQPQGELHDYVGGPEHYKILLGPLESLICGEENAVRLIVSSHPYSYLFHDLYYTPTGHQINRNDR